MQSAARIMGYDIGFLFQKDAAFEAGCESFLKANPNVRPALVEVMKHNRATWQTDLGRFRNEYLEHQKMTQEEVAGFYSDELAKGARDLEGQSQIRDIPELLNGVDRLARYPDFCGKPRLGPLPFRPQHSQSSLN
jgi:hypothetical protein